MQAQPSAANPPANQINIPLPSMAAHTLKYFAPSSMQASSANSEPLPPELKSSAESPALPVITMSARNARLHQSIQILMTSIAEKREQISQNLTNLRRCNAYLQSKSDEDLAESAQQIVSRHIKLLHRYNEIKDVGLGLMGLIADREGKRLGDIMKERDVNNED